MGLHELGHDLVLARELGFELLNLLVFGVFDGLGVAAILEEGVAVLEELLLFCLSRIWKIAPFGLV